MTAPTTSGEPRPLATLADLLPRARVVGDGSVAVTGLQHDSRRVQPGDLFVCIRGEKSDGHEYLPQAVQRGAVAAAVQEGATYTGVGLPLIVVPDSRASLGPLAAAVHGWPSRSLRLVGVTGTNGKTTTTQLIKHIVEATGGRGGVIGTLGATLGDRQIETARTTPEASDLQALLAQMVAFGGGTVAMEVSSHALVLDRTLGCEFDVGVFTNLTQDHLDFHGTMDEYLRAKLTLFEAYPERSGKSFTGVINADDPAATIFADRTQGRVLTYGTRAGAELRATEIEARATGLRFAVNGRLVTMRLGGLFNVSNALAAAGAAVALSIELEAALAALETAPPVDGRFEQVSRPGEPAVVVDYAHTPDGLENVLRAARALHPRRLWVVFGCGGDRDPGKRPLMGRIAAELADRVVVTSDNPRSEEPASIVAQIMAGISAEARERIAAEVDRTTAIHQVVAAAAPEDLVVIAGKGHETYQIFADRTIHYDDREVAREALNARASA